VTAHAAARRGAACCAARAACTTCAAAGLCQRNACAREQRDRREREPMSVLWHFGLLLLSTLGANVGAPRKLQPRGRTRGAAYVKFQTREFRALLRHRRADYVRIAVAALRQLWTDSEKHQPHFDFLLPHLLTVTTA